VTNGIGYFMIILHIIYIITGALTLNEKEPSNQSEIKEDSETIKKKEQEKEKRKRKKTGAIITIIISSIYIVAIIFGLIQEMNRFRSNYSSLILISLNIIGIIFIFINLSIIISFSK
jgi:hypothetical protein